MKYSRPEWLAAIAIFAAIAMPAQLGAQTSTPPSYSVAVLGTLDGTISGANSVNNLGWATGFSHLAANRSQHAVLWTAGGLTDLGTLGGDNSSVAWPNHNDQGMIAGIAETADLDPF